MRELTSDQARNELLSLLRTKSVFKGHFKLSSGGTSNYYIDCKLTTLDPEGAWLTGRAVHDFIREREAALNQKIDAVGGLTMGADSIALAAGMYSARAESGAPFQTFTVRKSPKQHGQTKLVEGNFKSGDNVAIVDDVITRGESTVAAIEAVRREGGKVAFALVLVDRQEGGREKIEAQGCPVFALFNRDRVLGSETEATGVPNP